MTSITVRDIMTHSPIIMSPDKTVQDAARIMKERNCGALLVGSVAHAQGIITDRDIVVRVLADGKDPSKVHLRSVMSKPLHCCDVDTTLEQAAEQMRVFEVRRLVVIKDGYTNGVITLASMLQNAGTQRLGDNVLHTLLGTRRKQHEMVVSALPDTDDYFENFEGVF